MHYPPHRNSSPWRAPGVCKPRALRIRCTRGQPTGRSLGACAAQPSDDADVAPNGSTSGEGAGEDEQQGAGASPWSAAKRKGRRRDAQQAPRAGDAEEPTELIVNLFNRGEGWGEEFIPHVTVEQRTIKRKTRSSAAPWQEGSIERMLLNEGVPEDVVDDAVARVIAWRITRGGRTLVDKRRRRRVELNLPEVAAYLHAQCGVARGPRGTGAILARFPHILLCKPSSCDRFDRRVLELAAYVFVHGSADVPDAPPHSVLAAFVQRCRTQKAQGAMPEERALILEGVTLEWDDAFRITPDWEVHFDYLLDFLLRSGDTESGRWKVTQWRLPGRERVVRRLAAWVLHQRHLFRAGLLPQEALTRLQLLDIEWDEPGVSQSEQAWLAAFGALAHVAHRSRAAADASSRRLISIQAASAQPDDDSDDVSEDEYRAGAHELGESSDYSSGGGTWKRSARKTELPVQPLASLESASMPAHLWLWFERQRTLWRHNRLPPLHSQLFYAAGIDLNPYSTQQWRVIAHSATASLNFCPVPLLPAAAEAAPASPGGASSSAPSEMPAFSISATRRWVQCQRRLQLEGRLSPAQHEYLRALGLGWVLAAEDAHWDELFAEVLSLLRVSASVAPADHEPLRSPAHHGAALGPREAQLPGFASLLQRTAARAMDAALPLRTAGAARAMRPSPRMPAASAQPALAAAAELRPGPGRAAAPPALAAAVAEMSRSSGVWVAYAERSTGDGTPAIQRAERASQRRLRRKPGALEDWLQVQLGLNALGALSQHRHGLVAQLRTHLLERADHMAAGAAPGDAADAWIADLAAHVRGEGGSRRAQGPDAPSFRKEWGQQMAALMQFRRQYGHVRVPPSRPHEELHDWLYRQRSEPALRPLLVSQLRAVGVQMPQDDDCL